MIIQDSIFGLIEYDDIDVFHPDRFEGRAIGITFDCTWNDEKGVVLKLINEEVVEAGYQDTMRYQLFSTMFSTK